MCVYKNLKSLDNICVVNVYKYINDNEESGIIVMMSYFQGLVRLVSQTLHNYICYYALHLAYFTHVA